jgi:hypothetical protein
VDRHVGNKVLVTDDVFLTLPFAGGAFGFVGTGSSWTGFTGIGFSGSLKVHRSYVRLDFRAQIRNTSIKEFK